MEIFIPVVVIFIVSILLIELIFYAYRTAQHPDRNKIRKKLKKIKSDRSSESEMLDLTRRRILSSIPFLNQILQRITIIERLDRLVYQANTKYPLGFFILLSLLFAGIGFTGFFFWVKLNLWLCVPLALLFGSLPIVYLYIKKNRRMNKFQAQLPEALDMMARSLRAGHAFSTGMKLASDEFEDPIGPEFEITLDEINYGLGVPEALKNLVNRLDCNDLNFFAIAVILQRETGGNLAEVMENIAYLIRERFKLYGQIKTLAAEGKLSMYVLLALPFVIVAALFWVNPTYIKTLFAEPIGRTLCVFAAIMMVIGAYVMRRMVDIDV